MGFVPLSRSSVFSYTGLRSDLQNGTIRVESVVRSALDRIKENQDLNAFLSVFPERALEKAREVDQKLSQGQAGELAGMIVAVKDLIAIKAERLTCGSRILENYVSPFTATAVERLEAQDAIVIGKTNLDEFGMGSSNENSAFGPVKNPYDKTRVPGGSSGGSAVAVAANMVMTALGTDTGGSVRQPAAYTGTIGIRPTYGRVSRYGLVAFASSLDQIGCFANTVEDCALVLRAIAGRDPKDATSSDVPVPNYTAFLNRDVKGQIFGVPQEYMGEGLQPEIREGIEKVLDHLEKGGATIQSVSLPTTPYGIATYYLICTAEASSNLARYDGVRYGLRKGENEGLEAMYIQTRHDGFGQEVKRRILLGTYVLSAGYYEAYYRKAQKVRTLIRKDFDSAFQKCDILIGPVTPTTAFRLGEKVSDPLQMYLSDIYTVTPALAGLPCISIPIGHDDSGLPIGLQLIGKPFQEGELLGVAHWILQEIESH